MAYEQPAMGCNHGPYQEGPYGRRCKTCGQVVLEPGYQDFFERSVRRGMSPYCAICGESMDEIHLLHFRCQCGFAKRYRPAIANNINGLAKFIGMNRFLKHIYYETEAANTPHFCFLCDCGAFRKVAELTIQCDWCGLTIKRDKDKVIFEVSYKSD